MLVDLLGHDKTRTLRALDLTLTDSTIPACKSLPAKPGSRMLAVLPAATAVAPVKIAMDWKRILKIWWITGVDIAG